MPVIISRPEPGEYADSFYRSYIDAVTATDGLTALEGQAAVIDRLAAVGDEQSAFRYAPGKWSVRQVTGHLADAERIFSYRLLRIARGDETPLPGFDENAYVDRGGFDGRTQAALGSELAAVRASTLALVRSPEPAALTRQAIVNGHVLSVRALVFVIAGHCGHHFRLLRERYGLEI